MWRRENHFLGIRAYCSSSLRICLSPFSFLAPATEADGSAQSGEGSPKTEPDQDAAGAGEEGKKEGEEEEKKEDKTEGETGEGENGENASEEGGEEQEDESAPPANKYYTVNYRKIKKGFAKQRISAFEALGV